MFVSLPMYIVLRCLNEICGYLREVRCSKEWMRIDLGHQQVNCHKRRAIGIQSLDQRVFTVMYLSAPHLLHACRDDPYMVFSPTSSREWDSRGSWRSYAEPLCWLQRHTATVCKSSCIQRPPQGAYCRDWAFYTSLELIALSTAALFFFTRLPSRPPSQS